MLEESKLIAFGATTRPEDCKSFYGDLLGLTLVADEPFALAFDARGTMLRIQKVEAVTDVPYTVLGWEVDDLSAVVGQLEAARIPVERFPGLEQDDEGIVTFPGGTRVAWFRDPEGLMLSLTQMP